MKLAQVPLRNTLFNSHPGANTLSESPGSLISHLLPNAIALAAVIFFIMIIIGGYGLIIGAGKNASAQDAAKSKAALTWGVIGFLLVISSYFILQIAGAIIGVDLISPPVL